MASSRSKHRRELRKRSRVNERIENLEAEARGHGLWLDLYDERPIPHEEAENRGWAFHTVRYERIVKEIYRLDQERKR